MPVFRKPTWHNEVEVYNYNVATDAWGLGDPITGQIYTGQRGQDDESGMNMYFEYPKEDDRLRDHKDHDGSVRTDAILLSFPTEMTEPLEGAREVGFWVREVEPRWLGFVNEHIIASLEKMTPSEIAMVTAGDSSMLFDTEITIHHAPRDASSPAEFVATTTGKIVYQELGHHADTYTSLYCLMKKEDYLLVQDNGQYWHEDPVGNDLISAEWPTGSGRIRTWKVGTCEPRYLGQANEHIAICMEPILSTEYELYFPEPEPEPPEELSIEEISIADGTCSSCEDLSGPLSLALTDDEGPNYAWELAVPFTCFSPDTEVTVTVNYNSETGIIVLSFATATLGQFQQYQATVADWDMVSAQILSVSLDEGIVCTWPATITVGT